MHWTPATKTLPKPALLVLGAILESDSRRAVRLVRWVACQWQYEPSGTEVGRYGHRVTHWMPLPDPPSAEE